MSRPKLLYKISPKQASIMATVAIMGMVVILSTLLLVSDSVFNSYAIDDPNAAMVDDQHYVSLSVSNADLSFTPADGSLADSKHVGVTVSTNVPGGARLYLSTADNTNALYKDGDTSSAAIQPTSDNTTLANMPTNTWGYSLDNTNFQAVPISDSAALIANVDGSSIGATSGGVTSAIVPVYYGAKVDSSLPAGTYTNRVVYSAIGTIPINISSVTVSVDGEAVGNLQVGNANTITVTTDLMTSELGVPRVYLTTTNPAGTTECGNVNVAKNSQGYMTIACTVAPTAEATGVTLHITQGSSGDWKWGDFTHALPDIVSPVSYMQDFTASQCDSMAQGDQIQLVDSRDNKTYWVGKLPDGNCWMTQNLDLNLSADITFTPDDTNISANWRPSVSTTTGNFSGYDYSSDSNERSHDPGFTQAYEGIYDPNDPNTSHYLVGNYYQWGAATAGYTGTGESVQSICPAGWTLPSRSQLQALLNSGLSNSNFMNAPYFLLRGGFLSYTYLYGAKNFGVYWSSTPYDLNSAYVWYLNTDDIVTHFVRYFGPSVRCVAAG